MYSHLHDLRSEIFINNVSMLQDIPVPFSLTASEYAIIAVTLMEGLFDDIMVSSTCRRSNKYSLRR